MKKSIFFTLLLVMMTAMVFFASCAKKPQDSETYPSGDEAPMDAREGEEAETEMERQRRIAEEGIEESRTEEGIESEGAEDDEAAIFPDANIYFEFDNSSLNAEARELLLKQARWLKKNQDRKLVVEGHCDSRGTEEYNLALGSRRAQSVKDFLVDAGVDASQIATVSYGEERPAVEGDNEDAWAQNRRAEFRLR